MINNQMEILNSRVLRQNTIKSLSKSLRKDNLYLFNTRNENDDLNNLVKQGLRKSSSKRLVRPRSELTTNPIIISARTLEPVINETAAKAIATQSRKALRARFLSISMPSLRKK